MTTSISADEALLWLQSYHAETLSLAREMGNAGAEMARSAHDIYAVREDGRYVQRQRYQAAVSNFERLRNALTERATALRSD